MRRRWQVRAVSRCADGTLCCVGVAPVQDYIASKMQDAVYLPHTAGRYQVKRFRKAQVCHCARARLFACLPGYSPTRRFQCPIVERLVNALMFKGRNNGKKMMAVRIVKHTFDIIHLLTDENPIQVLLTAIRLSGPREDSTRIGAAGIVRRQAVDVSPFRRVNQALYLISIGVRWLGDACV